MVPFALLLGCVLQLVVLLSHLPQSQAGRIIPALHTLPDGLQAVNGSLTGRIQGVCDSISSNLCMIMEGFSQSDLLDNILPTVECFEDDWAAGFFTVRRNGMDPIRIGFQFESNMNNASLVDLTVLNSPSRGIGTPSEIAVYGSFQFPQFDPQPSLTGLLENASPSVSFRDCLQTISMNLPFTAGRYYQAYFIELNPSTEWVFIAEVTFYSNQATGTGSSVSISPIVCPGSPTQTSSFFTSTVSLAIQTMSTDSDFPITHTLPTTSQDGIPMPTAVVDHGQLSTSTATASKSPVARSEGDQGSSTTIAIVVVIVCVLLIVLIVAAIIIVLLVIHLRKRQESKVGKFQSAMMEHDNVELTSFNGKKGNKTKIDNLNYESLFAAQQPKVSDSTPQTQGDEDATTAPLYAAVQKEPPPQIPEKSAALIELLEMETPQQSQIVPFSEAKSSQEGPSFPAQEATPPENLQPPVPKAVYPSHTNQSETETADLADDLYATPTPTNQEESDIGPTDTIYSEAIKPSLFTDQANSRDDLDPIELPYASIYTVPVVQPKQEEPLLEVTNGNIREVRQLGMGQFGQVVLAETVGLSLEDMKMSSTDNDKSKSVLVAVKKLRPNAPRSQKEAFEKEYKFMARLRDPNVIRLLGICTTDTPFIMMEYMEKGDLNQYLQKFASVTSETELPGEDQISRSTLLYMSTQTASAMKYLESHNFVHRDLATRNCLVGQNYLVKIADFGMSRNLYEMHYYRIHGRVILPIRWMATECFYGKFSQKTDVWAFGVTMWEIYSLAKQQPYHNLEDQELVRDATKGVNRHLLEKPKECPPEVYEIMLECWAHNPNNRATFEELHSLLLSV